jgi:hypothetical protein
MDSKKQANRSTHHESGEIPDCCEFESLKARDAKRLKQRETETIRFAGDN